MKFALLAIVCASSTIAGPLNGPQPGYILDARSGTLRPVLGIPGAMQLGAPVSLPFQVTSADFDASGNFAVVVSNEMPSHAYVLQGLANPSITDMGAVADHTSILGLSSNGQVAVLSAPGQLQFLTAVTTAPVLANAFPTQALLGPISAGIVDAAGQCALVGTASGNLGAFETFCADGSTQRLFTQTGMQITAIALANQGQDALLADSGGQQILRAAAYAQPGAFTAVASAQDGIANPVGLQVNGQQAIVADAGASCLFVIDLSGQAPTQAIPLNNAPARAKPLSDRTVLLLTDPTAAPFISFDLRAMQPFFIPTN